MPLSTITALDKFLKFYKNWHVISVRAVSLRRCLVNEKKIVKQIFFYRNRINFLRKSGNGS